MGNEKLVTIGPFKRGVNNRAADHALDAEPLTSDRREISTPLRSASNVQIDDTGRLSRRDGFAQAKAAVSQAHSGFGCEAGIFYADGNDLKLFDPDTGATTTLRSDMTAGAGVAYVEVNGEVYYANGSITGKVVAGANCEWGVESPAGVPVLSAVTGALPPGRYQVALTHEAASGEESGAGLANAIEVAAGQGINIAGILAPTSAEVAKVNIYCSHANGDVLYRIAQLPAGAAAAFQFLSASYAGDHLTTQFMSRPLPGNVLAYYNGRIYFALGKFVFYTEPLAYGLCRMASNFLMFAQDVTVVAGVADGLYIAADQTYFYAGGDPADFAQRAVLPYGAARGSATRVSPDADTWTWYSDRGMVMAGNGGQIKALQEKELSLDAASVGASLFLEQDGQQQIISLTTQKNYSSSAAAQGFVDMEIRRKGA